MRVEIATLALAAVAAAACSRGTSVPAAPVMAPVAPVQVQPAAAARQAAQDTSHHLFVVPDRIQWGAGPASLPPGTRMAVIHGDPARSGLFAIRVRLPDGYRVPPHFHGSAEHITVISGTFAMGLGERFDAGQLTPIPAGGFARMEAGTRHYVMAQGETVIQIHALGPWIITYVSPSDDPRARTP